MQPISPIGTVNLLAYLHHLRLHTLAIKSGGLVNSRHPDSGTVDQTFVLRINPDNPG